MDQSGILQGEAGMRAVIIVCRCGDSPRFAEEAFRLQFPDRPLPRSVQGRDALREYEESLPDGKAKSFVHGISGKYMYYLETTDDGDIALLQNLRDGRRVV